MNNFGIDLKYYKDKSPKKMISKSVGGIRGEVYIYIGRTYDFIEATCSSVFHPDFAYKRFSDDLEGYKNAHTWVIITSAEMEKNRLGVIGFNYSKEPLYPRCYDWNEINIENEPCQLSIQLT